MSKTKLNLIKAVVILANLILAADYVYKTVNDITYANRDNCFFYQVLPKFGFLFKVYFIELFLVVIVGIFFAVLLEQIFSKYQRFYPRSPALAFVYASLIPVCSCSAIPLIRSLDRKLPFRTIVTFVISAPLLNPYIMVISFTVLGFEYGVLRIAASFVLAITCGYIVELFYNKEEAPTFGDLNCSPHGCSLVKKDVFENTYHMFVKIIPYLLAAAVLGFVFEMFDVAQYLEDIDLGNNFYSMLFVIAVGVPVYFCNGADVLFLKPLIYFSGMPLGTAMAFSLTSTSVCLTSLVMLIRFIGKKATFVLLTTVVLMTFLIAWIINLVV